MDRVKKELAVTHLGLAAVSKMVGELRQDIAKQHSGDELAAVKEVLLDAMCELQQTVEKAGTAPTHTVDLGKLTADVAGIRRALEDIQAVQPAEAWTFTVSRDARTGLIESISAKR